MPYEPDYADDMILVYMKPESDDENFMREYAESTGFRYIGPDENSNTGYMVGVEKGKTQEAIDFFNDCHIKNILDGASLYDRKLDLRWSKVSEAKNKLEDIFDIVDSLSAEDFNQCLEDVIAYLGTIKESD